jgi:hypothetical protein
MRTMHSAPLQRKSRVTTRRVRSVGTIYYRRRRILAARSFIVRSRQIPVGGGW